MRAFHNRILQSHLESTHKKVHPAQGHGADGTQTTTSLFFSLREWRKKIDYQALKDPIRNTISLFTLKMSTIH